MLFETFINREREIAETCSYHRGSQERVVTMVVGPTGVGKSEFTAELMRRLNCPTIRVLCPSPINRSSLKDGAYIRNLSEWFDRSSAALGLTSIESFANTISTLSLSEDYNKRLLQDGRSLPGMSIAGAMITVAKRITGKAYRREELYRHSATWDSIIHYDYLSFALREKPLTVVMENFQLVDYESQTLIRDLMWNLTHVSWLLEYTAEDSDSTSLSLHEDLGKHLRRQAHYVKLRPLPISHIFTAGGILDQEKASFLSLQYQQHCGNLRIIVDAIRMAEDPREIASFYASQVRHPEADATTHRLKLMPSEPMMVLALLIAGGAHLEQKVIEEACTRLPNVIRTTNLELVLAYLINEGFIEKRSSVYFVAHDSLTCSFAGEPSQSLSLLLARDSLEKLYSHWLASRENGTIDRRELLRRLFTLKVGSDPVSILAEIEDLREIVLANTVRREAKQFLERLTSALAMCSGVSSKSWWQLASLCYDAGIFDMGYQLVSRTVLDEAGLLLRGFILHNLDRNEEALELAERLLRESAHTPVVVASSILKMTSLRAIGMLDEARTVANAVLAASESAECVEYGYFLRNLEFLAGPARGLDYLRGGVDFFLARNEPEAVAHTRINLAMQLARLGHLTEAWEQLDLAEGFAGLRVTDWYLIWNNRAAIMLLRGDATSDARLYLNRALLSCDTVFNRLNIKQNLLIWHMCHQEASTALELADEIAALIKAERDPHENAVVAANLMQFYETIGDPGAAAIWRQRLIQVAEDHDVGYQQYWLRRAAPITKAWPESGEFSFLLSFPFHVAFLAHWSFPIDCTSYGCSN